MNTENRLNRKYNKGDLKKINYSREEFDESLGRYDGYFLNHINKLESYYNLQREDFKCFGMSGQYNISYLMVPSIKIMIENITQNPYADGRLAKVEDRKNKKERHKNASYEDIKEEKKTILENGNGLDLDKIITYNYNIIKDIENLPKDIKFNLKRNSTYESNYVLNEVIPPILDRLSILFSLLISQSSVSAGNSYIELINALDSWIRNFAIHSVDMEEIKDMVYREGIDSIDDLKNGKKSKLINIGADKMFNDEVDKSYMIDSILREEYYRNLELGKILNKKIRENGLIDLLKYIGYDGSYGEIDKNNIDRNKVLEWIGYSSNEYNKSITKDLNILEDKLLDFKNKIKTIDELKNGKMMRVNFYKEIMRSIVNSLGKDPIPYRNRIIDDIIGFIEPRELGLCMGKHLKQIINLNSYKTAISLNTIYVDNNFDKDLEIYAIKLWEEYDCKDKKKEKKVEKVINGYYEKLRNEDGQILRVRNYLTKAIEEMIIPKFIDEINHL